MFVGQSSFILEGRKVALAVRRRHNDWLMWSYDLMFANYYAVVWQPSSPVVVCSSMGCLLPAVRLFCRTPPAVSWVGCVVDVRTAAPPRCRYARVVLSSVMLSSRRVSIAVVPATRRKGSGHDEPVAFVVGPLSPVPVVLDHLLLSCHQVSCYHHTLSLQLLLAFGQDVILSDHLTNLAMMGCSLV